MEVPTLTGEGINIHTYYREDLKVDILKHEDQDTPEKDCDEGVHGVYRNDLDRAPGQDVGASCCSYDDYGVIDKFKFKPLRGYLYCSENHGFDRVPRCYYYC